MIEFTIPIEPVTKKNSQQIFVRNGKPFVHPSKKFTEYQNTAGWYIPCKNLNLDKPLELSCRFFMKTRRRVDLTNLLGAICDILVHYKVIADDNSNIVVSHDGSRVYYDKQNPRTEVIIREVDNIGR